MSDVNQIKQRLASALNGAPVGYCDLIKDALAVIEQQEAQIKESKDTLEDSERLALDDVGKLQTRIAQLEAQLRDKDKAATQLISAIRRGVDQEELGEAIQACEQALHQPRKP